VWQKLSCYKIKDALRRAEILHEISLMMYDRSSLTEPISETWANDKLDALRAKYLREKKIMGLHDIPVGQKNPYVGRQIP